MSFDAFELSEPLPELTEPHALAIIQPWIDAGKAGSLTMSRMEKYLGAKKLAKLARPGNFFDFTRYRPIMVQKENQREIDVPNIVVSYGRDPDRHDFLFLRFLEPHTLAEVYIESVIDLLKSLRVKRYCLLGSMYDLVPYTRPLLVTGGASNLALQNALTITNVIRSGYQGPTTILSLIGQEAVKSGIETCTMIVHLPSYLTLEEDYRGEKRLMEIISSFYNIPMSQTDLEKAREQEEQIKNLAGQFLQREPQYRAILEQLESSFDSRLKDEKPEIPLSPEIEKFLQGLNIRFKQD